MLRGIIRFRLADYLLVSLLIAGLVFVHSSSAFSAEKESGNVEKKIAAPEAEKRTSKKPRRRRILYFYASYCTFCQSIKQKEFPRLKSVKWKIGSKDTNHIQEMNAEKFPELIEKYKLELLPTFILFVKGKEVDRRYGPLTAHQIAEFYYRRLKKEAEE